MRDTIVHFLNQATGPGVFEFIIPTLKVMNFIAFCAVSICFIRRCGRSHLDTRASLYCVLWGGIFAFAGAKLFYVALHMNSFISKPFLVATQGGTVSWGAYMGVILGMIVVLRRMKRPISPFLDCLGSCLALGSFIGRLGCFLRGCDYGTASNLPWAVQYPRGSIPFTAHVSDGLIGPGAHVSAPVHPNQIYLSLSALVIFIFMTWFWRKMRKFPGLTFGAYLGGYGWLRFFLERFRDEPATRFIPALNFSQVMSLVTLACGVMLLLYLYRSRKKHGLINDG